MLIRRRLKNMKKHPFITISLICTLLTVYTYFTTKNGLSCPQFFIDYFGFLFIVGPVALALIFLTKILSKIGPMVVVILTIAFIVFVFNYRICPIPIINEIATKYPNAVRICVALPYGLMVIWGNFIASGNKKEEEDEE